MSERAAEWLLKRARKYGEWLLRRVPRRSDDEMRYMQISKVLYNALSAHVCETILLEKEDMQIVETVVHIIASGARDDIPYRYICQVSDFMNGAEPTIDFEALRQDMRTDILETDGYA